ncbi:peptidase M1, membrane alanine aminopeptidase, partial [mine drainage metagenome]
ADVSKTLMGLYLAKAVDGSEMLTTQFESTGARMAFPCVDDPSWKAVFRLRVKVDDGLDVISNMPPEKVESLKGKKNFVFQDTPRMSTYLLYLGIGKFETRSGKYNGKDVYLSGLANNLDSTDFPLTVGKQSLEFFDSYFGINYALPKMHLISIPEFGAGAMENWGAITFRETALLVNKNTSEITKKRVASVIAHEIAHQWFGDLVTMKWWNDLWLNESFATFMMYKMVEKYYPDWKITAK